VLFLCFPCLYISQLNFYEMRYLRINVFHESIAFLIISGNLSLPISISMSGYSQCLNLTKDCYEVTNANTMVVPQKLIQLLSY